MLAVGAFLAGFSSRTIVIQHNGERIEVEAVGWRVGEVLQEAGLSVREGDDLSDPLSQWLWGGETIVLEQAARVMITADGRSSMLLTTNRLPAALLEEAGVSLGEYDLLLFGSQPWDANQPLPYQPSAVLQVRRAAVIHLREGAEEVSFHTTAASLAQALWEQGIRLQAGDRLDPPAGTPLDGRQGYELEATITRGRVVSVQVEGRVVETYSAAETVGELLAESGLSLQGLDFSIPAEDSPVPEEQKVQVVRVFEEALLEQSPLAFETEYLPSDELDLDTKTVIQTGEYGLLTRRVRVVYHDGVEVERQAEDEFISRQPRNRIVGLGTRVVMKTADTPDGPIQYWRSLQMWATSYHPSTTSNRTASGLPLKKGVAAVDTRYIPFNTQMYVPGYGHVVAADRGGGIVGRMIDLGYSDEDWVSWHHWVTVYFLWPPPENIVWNIP